MTLSKEYGINEKQNINIRQKTALAARHSIFRFFLLEASLKRRMVLSHL
jgi:hypothetical protein